jgi:hypothetical protein
VSSADLEREQHGGDQRDRAEAEREVLRTKLLTTQKHLNMALETPETLRTAEDAPKTQSLWKRLRAAWQGE